MRGGSSDTCDTEYPIVLAHGMGASAEILGIVDYWWGIEDAAWYSPGCDHLNMVGHLFGATPGFDAPEFFVDIVRALKDTLY